MRRFPPSLLAMLLLAPLLAVLGMSSAAEAASGQRATWVWTRPAAKTLVSWARKQGVSELFVHVGPALATSSDLSWARSVSTQAHASGIRVSALGGETSWIDDPAAAVAWEQSAVSTGLFDGVHVDIEPWTRADWQSDQAAVVSRYLEVLRRLDDATTLPLEADIAFWLWQVQAGAVPLDEAVMGIVDAVTVLSYRNTATGPDSITDIGAHELATASTARIPCRLAVETNYLGPDAVSRKQTFYGLGVTTLRNALATVDSVEGGVAAYHGVAVHDYDGWRALR